MFVPLCHQTHVFPRKSHALGHVVLDFDIVPTVNIWKGCCWMEEDSVGKIMKVLGCVKIESLSVRTMEYVSALIPLVLKCEGLA